MKILITVSGEIPIKYSRARRRMYGLLLDAIKKRLEASGSKLVNAKIINAKILVEAEGEEAVLLETLSKTFGVKYVSVVREIEFSNLEDLSRKARDIVAEKVKARKFAVRVKRRGEHAFTSIDVARAIGAVLLPFSAGVDLENPEVEVKVEISGSVAYIEEKSAKGPGGFPVGSGGKGLVLFSGGYDSPVAAWMAAKRGVLIDFLHFYMGSSHSTANALKVAKKLYLDWLYPYEPRLYVVDLTPGILEITQKVKWSFRQVILRVLMYKIASVVAESNGYDAIITGESIAQASSQTLRNIASIEKVAKPVIPIIRPLVGMDKEEIIEISRNIGLYEYSSRVTEACAIAPRHVETQARWEDVAEEFSKINAEVVNKVVKSIAVYNLHTVREVEILSNFTHEIDYLPQGAILVDVRDYEEYRKGTLPEAIHVSALENMEIDGKTPIVFFCETGVKSSMFALTYRERGYLAFSLRGGLLALRERGGCSERGDQAS